VAEKTRELTQQQKDFIDHLLGEAKGDYKKALVLAGYSENTRASDLIKSLRQEIIDASLNHLALNAPKAAHELTDVMANPTKSGAVTVMKTATEILNRVGVSATKTDGVDLKVPAGGLFIMPAKEVPSNINDTKETENG
jgi:hypothetical protein